MTRRRRHPLRRRKVQRTLLQIAIFVTVLAFIGLYNPVIRAGVNATLVWLVVRGLILGVIVLAIMWTYQFCRPPKVKRGKMNQPLPLGRHTSRANGAMNGPSSASATTPGRHTRNANGAITTHTDAPVVAPTSPTAQRSVPNVGTSRDDLLNTPMSGVHQGPWFYGDGDS